MKNTNYIINGILAVAVIALFILQFSKKESGVSNDLSVISDSTISHLPVAYIWTDSLLMNYKFSIDLNESLMKKIEKERVTISQRSQKFEKEIYEYQQRVQANAYLSTERQQQEETRLSRLQQDLQSYDASVREELAIEQNKLNQQLQDTIISALRLFNTPQKYQIIFGNVGTDNILYADDSYDITKEIIEFLNARYTPAK
ncbi:membrane protein [Bacteroidia bacterium]|nr:membrane protein [Bacteroidia bacterium]